MGRIFSFEEIAVGHIPTPEDFGRAADAFEELSDDAVERELFDGAFIFGSVAVGLASRRSDFDAFISLTDNHVSSYDAVRNVATGVREASRYRVPFIPIVQTAEALEAGRHEMDRLFGQHLQSGHRLTIGSDPARYIRFNDQPASSILADYIAHKKRRLTDTYLQSYCPDMSKGLQRLLELPVAVGRKAIQAFAETKGTIQPVEMSADKSAVTLVASQLFDEFGLCEGFDDVLDAERSYEQLLEDAVVGDIDGQQYAVGLLELQNRIPGALIWLDQIEQELLPEL